MISIKPLKDHMNHVPALASIWCEVLGKPWIPEVTAKEVERWMVSWKHETELPLAYAAINNETPVGVCALQKSDGIRPELYPWLTDLSVHRNFQRQGIGKLLVQAIKNKAIDLGYNELYLFAFDVNLIPYYEALRFKIIGRDRHRDLPVVVMKSAL